MILLYALIGGLLYRIRGGGIGPIKLPGTQQARIMFGAATGLLAWWLGVEWYFSIAVALGIWIGLIDGWSEWFDIGENDGEVLDDMIGMSLRGLILTTPAGCALIFSISIPLGIAFALSGLALGPIYWLGWRIPSTIPDFQRGPPIAEVITGAWLWAVLAFVV